MQYWMNVDSGNVIAREFGDEPVVGEWLEISEAEYQEALHPLSPANTGLQADTANRCPSCGEYYNWHLPNCAAMLSRRAAKT